MRTKPIYGASHRVAIVVLTVITVVVAFWYGAEKDGQFTCDPTPHTVSYGDTLWDIARQNCEGSVEAATDRLVSIYGATIHPNQIIWLPTTEDCPLEDICE